MPILFIILICFFIFNCGGGDPQERSSPPDSSMQKKETVDYHSVDGFFNGNHALALIKDISKDPNDTGYVCLSDTGTAGMAKFYFQQPDGFLNALIPMSKIRVSFLADTSHDAPYCKFRWGSQDFKEREWANNVVYAVICVKPYQIYRK